MSYSEVPIGLSLILCDTILEDKLTNKKSLIGLFSQISCRSLPVTHSSMSLFVSLTGGMGDYPLEVQCTHADLDAPVLSVKCDVHLANPMQVHELNFQIKNVRFPVAGHYWLKVLVDGVPLMIRPLLVAVLTPEAEGSPSK